MEQQSDPAQQARLEAARADERDALAAYLQNRVVLLNAEVRVRDERIATREAELADARADASQNPQAAVPDEPTPES
jgi:cytidylate kinase